MYCESVLIVASRPLRFPFGIHQSAWSPWVSALDSTYV